MDQKDLRVFEGRCIQEEPPACQTVCPLHVEARSFAALMAEGKMSEARKTLDRIMPLSAITGYLCSGYCLAGCRRREVDSAVNLPLLERACLRNSSAARIMALPQTGKKAAVLGSGLSALTAAFELGRKGHAVTVYHGVNFGGFLRRVPAKTLPPGALNEAREILAGLRVEFAEAGSALLGKDGPDRLAGKFDAVYLGFDDDAANFGGRGIPENAVTMRTADEKIFAGGLGKTGKDPGFILCAAEGRRAAVSMDRLLQGVEPGIMRDKDLPYESRLYVNLEGFPKIAKIRPEDPLAPTLEEAREEALRCLNCQCLECVKRCAYLRRCKGYPKKLFREIYNNLAVVQGNRNTLLINSCAECGLCAAVCPNQADLGDFCALARQELFEKNHLPASAHEFALEDLACGNAPETAFLRHHPGAKPGEKSAYLFFPGCQLPASMPRESELLYGHLRANLPGGAGLWLRCCGAPLKWAGRMKDLADLKKETRGIWEEAGKPLLVPACASCLVFFRAELPEIPVKPLWEILAELPLPDSAPIGTTLYLHDPCASRADEASRRSVRVLLGRVGQDFGELPQGREKTRCCGYGGLLSAANPALGDEFARDIGFELAAPGTESAEKLLTWCVMCRDRLAAVGRPTAHILNLLFPVSGQSPEQALARPSPGFSDRREERFRFRNRILHKLWGEPPVAGPVSDAVILHIPDEVAPLLEARRILRSDIKEILLDESNTLFRNKKTGNGLACSRPRQVSFWVEYSKNPDGSFTVHNAYCHRMEVPGVPGTPEPGSNRERWNIAGPGQA